MTPQKETTPNSSLSISTDQNHLDIDLTVKFLRETYWGKEFTCEQIQKSIKNSLCFGLFINQKQIGFARVITDFTILAWLADVFILPKYQRMGYGQFLVKEILNYDLLKGVRKWRLATRDAHEFYTRFGFTTIQQAERLMEKSNIIL